VDFLICHGKHPVMMIETKASANHLENSFHIFEKGIGSVSKIILVKKLDRNFTQKDGVRVVKASEWLAKMDF
jgi:hypothetical protein